MNPGRMNAGHTVLHVRSSAGLYGAEYVVLGLIPALAQLGIDSTLLSIDNHLQSAQVLYDRAVTLGVPVSRLPCRGRFDFATVRALREGVELDDGRTAPARVTVVQTHGATTAVELGIHEGRNRQVRRMCETVGHPVVRLVRTRIGPLRDGSLKPGTWRALTQAEVRRLYEAASASEEADGEPAKSPEADGTPG